MHIHDILQQQITKALSSLFQLEVEPTSIAFQKTRKEFAGDITLVVFPYTKASKKSPVETGNIIGEYLRENASVVSGYNVVQGFLNLEIAQAYWMDFFANNNSKEKYGYVSSTQSSPTIVVEYSSPNTNKPLHLGHIRNILLGYSTSLILEANGYQVKKVNIVNDRGVHICKSMFAYMQEGAGINPTSANKKGDHLVGDFYVAFDKIYKKEIAELTEAGKSKEEAEKQAPAMLAVQQMLQKWEQGDDETINLWKMMNGWVYDGFDVTYKRLGVDFDKIYYESNTYILGKDLVQRGLEMGVLFKKDDGSVWIDLTADGLDQKVVQRGDGTSLYITQDLGTAVLRQEDFNFSKMVYVVGNEQDYHFKVLFLILSNLGYEWANGLFHLSYGMVELPHGKMKSREGTVVDADDLMQEMYLTAKETTEELGKTEGMTSDEAHELYETIGMGALKYFMLKVDPKKKMLFDPKESIDFHGNTAPFVQYTHARIKSILRKESPQTYLEENITLNEKEKSLLKTLHDFPAVLHEAGANYSPALIANYVYELAKEFNGFYHDHSILKEENTDVRNFRLHLATFTGNCIKNCMHLLGIRVPERM
jgi:arginyl-tRNA synthetase